MTDARKPTHPDLPVLNEDPRGWEVRVWVTLARVNTLLRAPAGAVSGGARPVVVAVRRPGDALAWRGDHAAGAGRAAPGHQGERRGADRPGRCGRVGRAASRSRGSPGQSALLTERGGAARRGLPGPGLVRLQGVRPADRSGTAARCISSWSGSTPAWMPSDAGMPASPQLNTSGWRLGAKRPRV